MVLKHRPACRELLFHELSGVNRLIALGSGDRGLLASVPAATRTLTLASRISPCHQGVSDLLCLGPGDQPLLVVTTAIARPMLLGAFWVFASWKRSE